jgi:hypothetical protein
MKNIEELQKNYEKYFKFFAKYFGEDVSQNFSHDFGERLSIAPRSIDESEGGYPGALIDFAFMTGRKAKELTILSNEEKESLIKVCLIHEIGKLGDELNEQFIAQDSSYYREKLGHTYKYNDKCDHMTFVHRTLYFIAKYGIKLTPDEFIAIITSGGFHLEENRFYGRDNHTLSHAFQLCKTVSEKELKAIAKAQNC